MKKYIGIILTVLLFISCGSGTVEGNPEYLTEKQITIEIESGTRMFFWDNEDGTVSVTYDHSNPMHVNINSGSSNDYYKGEIAIPSTITKDGRTLTVVGITESAFMNCAQLTKLSIPSTVRSIGKMAFYHCQLLEELNIPDGVSEIPDYCFSGCKALTTIQIAGSVKKLGTEAFAKCTELTRLRLPEGVTTIEANCFMSSGLTYISLPTSLTNLRSLAFNTCTKLKEISIPNNITTLEDSVFSGCSSLITAYLPETMTSLGVGSFAGCRSLIEMTIPASVRQIGKGCFCSVNSAGESNWKNLTLNIMATEPPILTASISNATARKRIVVPRGYRDAYLTAAYWNEFTQILETNY